MNDFFGKEFPAGALKFEARTVSSKAAGVVGKDYFSDEFKVTVNRDFTSGQVNAEVKNITNIALLPGKLDCKSTSTLTSTNQATQQLTLSNPALEGLKLELTGGLQPTGIPTQAKLALEVSQPLFFTTASLDLFKGPLVNADVATRCRDIQLGADLTYDMSKGAIDKYSVGLGLDRAREKVYVHALNSLSAYQLGYHQRFNEQVEVGYRATWNSKLPNLAMEVAAKYYLVGGGHVKAKLDNAGRLGLAFSTDLRPGIQLSLGANLDTAKFNDGLAHKFGVELNYSA